SGVIDHDCNLSPCNNFGLDIIIGDPFSGSFSYDSDSGTPIEFYSQFPTMRFDATGLFLKFQPFDGHLTFFNIGGGISSGLYMEIGLTNWLPVGDGSLPTHLSREDWFLSGFQINDGEAWPVEQGWTSPRYIGASSPDGTFTLQTVPEPSTMLLLGTGLAGHVGWKLKPGRRWNGWVDDLQAHKRCPRRTWIIRKSQPGVSRVRIDLRFEG
ncbi:MAG: PEP-CTERM sorting domain-containing protein, partial [Desulfoferrobacter sp.]